MAIQLIHLMKAIFGQKNMEEFSKVSNVDQKGRDDLCDVKAEKQWKDSD